MAQKNWYKEVDRFKCGRTTCDNEEQSGWPLMSDDQHAELDTLIKEDRWIIVSEIVLTVGISYGSAFAIIHNNLGYHKICARCVPQQLMENHRQTCLWISKGFLKRHSQEGEILLQQIAQVTRRGSISTNRALNNRVWSRNTPQSPETKYPSPWPLQVKWCCSCFGTVMVWYWNITLSKTPLFLLHHAVKYWNHSWSHWVTTSLEVGCPRGLSFSKIKHVHILQKSLLKQSGSWNLNFSHTPHIVWP